MSGKVEEAVNENPVEENSTDQKDNEGSSKLSEEEQRTKLAEKVDLTVGDVFVILNILDIASSRGTWRTNELRAIGEYYEKLVTFVPKELQKQ